MLKYVLRAAEVNYDYAKKLVADIPDAEMCTQAIEGMNHAAWVLGHLAFVFDSMMRVFDQPHQMPKDWVPLFNLSSKPSSDRSLYPSKDELWKIYEDSYRRAAAAIGSAPEEMFEREFPNPRLRPMLPTVGVAMVHILTTHHGLHLGQLSAWRRARGLPGVM